MTRRESLLMTTVLTVSLCFAFAAAGPAAAARATDDWPTWRHDARRSAATPVPLPDRLALHWAIRLPALKPAWPDEPRMQFDAAYQPVVAGRTLFVASSRNDSVTAYDVRDGSERWRFHADGPVRFAPVVSDGALYFTSDDGHLYCLDAGTGRLRWRVRGGPSGRLLLGNERLISAWPARGGCVVADGKVYFAAGIWPFMGVFLYAVDARTGKVLWCNDGCGALYISQPHNSSAFGGLAPQGYLAVSGERLIVPNGRAVAAALDRRTGRLLYFHHAANKRNGHSEAAATAKYFVNSGVLFDLRSGMPAAPLALAGITAKKWGLRELNSAQVIYDKLKREPIVPIGPIGVITDDTSYQSAGDAIVAADIAKPVTGTYVDDRGRKRRGPAARVLWRLASRAKPMLKAGRRLYAATGDEILAIDLPDRAKLLDALAAGKAADANRPQPALAWREKIAGSPASMIAAAGRLFVVTYEGTIHCRGEGGAERGRNGSRDLLAVATAPAAEAELADRVLRAAGAAEGYCLVLGMKDGRLAEQLARQSNLRVVCLDGDADRVRAFRRRVDAAGLPAGRLGTIAVDPLAASLPPYLASLIVCEDAAGLGPLERLPVERIFRVLRPYGGTLCLALPEAAGEAFRKRVAAANLAQAEVRQSDGLTLLIRRGPLPGAGTWTHQYGNAANTCVSSDERVKPPLGLLWFGGPSNKDILPRHGHGPPEQVIGGRLFIEGPDLLRALDVYTGRLLWQARLPGLGANYNYTTHEPGANALGTNYVATADGVYVVRGRRCLQLDPVTGRTVRQLAIPADGQGDGPLAWGYLAAADDLLVAGTSPARFWTPDFAAEQFSKTVRDASGKWTSAGAKQDLARLAEAVKAWKDFEPEQVSTVTVPPPDTQPNRPPTVRRATELDFVIVNVNKMLSEKEILAKLPHDVVEAARARTLADARKKRREGTAEEEIETLETVEAEIRKLSAGAPDGPDPRRLRVLNRRVLEMCYRRLPRIRVPKVGQDSLDHTASGELVVMNRLTGHCLWRRGAEAAFRHNAIAVGGGMLFCIDRLPAPVVRRLLRRGARPKAAPALLALDARTGSVLWSTRKDVFGTWLGYSAEHDVLLQAGRPSRDMLSDETNRRLIAYRGRTGKILWDRAVKYGGPCMLHGRTVITQGFALDLLTGRTRKRIHPLTGETINWKFARNYGCNTAIASRHLLTFRSAAAGYFDLAGDGGTGNLGGFKSGCTSNLVVADGVLNAPDYTRTCTCSYQNQSSLALVHMPEVEMWTFQDFGRGKKAIRAVGVNFGAPGDRRADDGTLWLEHPIVGGSSPKLGIRVEARAPGKVSYFRRHASGVRGGSLRWVAASGLEGAARITIPLASRKAKARTCTVTLHFAEPGAAGKGQRVFSVALQGKTVLRDFDVVSEAGAALAPVLRTFRGVSVRDKLEIELAPARGAKLPRPVLCGVEVKAEE